MGADGLSSAGLHLKSTLLCFCLTWGFGVKGLQLVSCLVYRCFQQGRAGPSFLCEESPCDSTRAYCIKLPGGTLTACWRCALVSEGLNTLNPGHSALLVHGVCNTGGVRLVLGTHICVTTFMCVGEMCGEAYRCSFLRPTNTCAEHTQILSAQSSSAPCTVVPGS